MPYKPLIAEEPSWNRHEQQQQGLFPIAAAAGSSFDLATIKEFVRQTRPTSSNPGGLAAYLAKTGEDDADIVRWLNERHQRIAPALDLAIRWFDCEALYPLEINRVIAAAKRNTIITAHDQLLADAAADMAATSANT